MSDDVDLPEHNGFLVEASRPWLAHLEFDDVEHSDEALRAFLVGLHCDTYGRFPTRADYTKCVDPAFDYIRKGDCLKEAK